MPEDVRFDAAIAAAREITGLTGTTHETGRALRFGQIAFIVLDAIHRVEEKLAGSRRTSVVEKLGDEQTSRSTAC
jgi:hypothetical protein